jgi:hypothetical protein
MRNSLWRGALGTALVTMGVFLAACSHDPIQPAPIYLKGATGPAETRPVARPVTSAVGPRQAIAQPASPAHPAPTEPTAKRPIAASHRPSRALKKAYAPPRPIAAAPSRRAYARAGSVTAASAAVATIPLDEPVASMAGPAAIPPGTGAREPTSSWVTPPPTGATAPLAEPPRAEFRPPSP